MLEIDNEPHLQTSYTQIVEHLAAFVIGDLIDHFGINHDLILYNQIWDEGSDAFSFVLNLKASLLVDSHPPQLKLMNQSILIRLFVQSMAQLIHHLERSTNDGMG